MTIREIFSFWKNCLIDSIDWVLNIRITWYAVQQITIALGFWFLLVVVGEFLEKVTEDLTGIQKTMVTLVAGFLLFLLFGVPYLIWVGWIK